METAQNGSGNAVARVQPLADPVEFAQEREAMRVMHENPDVAVAMARAKAEIQATIESMVIVAKRFPRDEVRCFQRVMEACKRKTLAGDACYSYPKGGTKVTGPSVYLIREIRRIWGNFYSNCSEVYRMEKSSMMYAIARDLEANVVEERHFIVPHRTELKDGVYKDLKSDRDIYELIMNMGTRRERALMESCLPADLIEDAVAQSERTLLKDAGDKPIIDRIKDMVVKFGEIGVPKEAIEKRLGHKIEHTNEMQFVDLRKIYNSIHTGMAGREKFFELDPASTDQASALNEKFGQPKAPAESEASNGAKATKGLKN